MQFTVIIKQMNQHKIIFELNEKDADWLLPSRAAAVAELSQVCACPWISKSAWRMKGWDSIAGESRQKNPIWRQGQRSHPKKPALFKTNTNASKIHCLSGTSVAMMDGFLWLHWSWNQFQLFETWWTIIKGQEKSYKARLEGVELRWWKEHNFSKPERGLLRTRPSKTVREGAQFLSIKVYCCSAKFPTWNAKSN